MAVLALNSYQERLNPVSVEQRSAESRLIAQSQLPIASPNHLQAATQMALTETTEDSANAVLDANTGEAQPVSVLKRYVVEADNSARYCSDDSELLGGLAADLARSAMKEGSIVLPRQIVQQQPRRSAPSMKLASFRLPRSTANIEPPQPASLLVSYQSRLLTAATDVRVRLATYLRWVRFCATLRGLASEFEQSYVQPVLDHMFDQQPAEDVLFDTDDETYDMIRYAVPIAYPS